jgi:hypothetical protein
VKQELLFVNKKKQKNFVIHESFLVLFSKKEPLAFTLLQCRVLG